ncbi:MAG: hypothetical protein K2N25_06450 [Muribaculaceae bacterium]|nr:hypothetical protein [Muribaculaceae bacterium]
MKKISLLLSALAVGLTASAQYQACFMDMSVLGFDGTVVNEAGTVLCEDENGKLSLAFDDTMKTFTPSAAPYTYVSINGSEPFKITAGCTGSTNGSSPLNAGTATMIESGCVYKLETTKTGYFIFLTKLNTNKNYYVMEGQNNLLAYALGVALDPAKNDAGVDRIYYTLPEDAFGNVDMAATDASKYLDGEAPDFTKIKTPGATTDLGNIGEGSGFLCIASYAEEGAPCTFYYWAQGSKMANNGFIFVPSEEPTLEEIPYIVFSGEEKTADDGTVTPAPTPVAFGSTAAVGSISVDNNENAPIYNAQGMRVNADAKGLLIQNGKKFIRK